MPNTSIYAPSTVMSQEYSLCPPNSMYTFCPFCCMSCKYVIASSSPPLISTLLAFSLVISAIFFPLSSLFFSSIPCFFFFSIIFVLTPCVFLLSFIYFFQHTYYIYYSIFGNILQLLCKCNKNVIIL